MGRVMEMKFNKRMAHNVDKDSSSLMHVHIDDFNLSFNFFTGQLQVNTITFERILNK